MLTAKRGAKRMKFTHPLARDSKVWVSHAEDGSRRRVLVIVTTLSLNPEGQGYKRDKVRRLSEYAKGYVSENPGEADAFLLMNRVKDWHPGRT